MESKSLRYFYEVARLQSFTLAAAHLHIAQPAMSMAIRKLEEELGLSLFHRIDRQVSLTDEGKCLYRHAQVVLQQMADAELEMEELRGLTNGKVRVGMPGMLGSCYFPPALMAFCRRFPGIKLSIVDGGADRLQRMLIDAELDLAFVVAENIPDTLCSETFLHTQIMAAVPRDHPFASLTALPVDEFLQQELVMFKQGYFHRRIIDQVAETMGIPLNIRIETNLIGLMKSLVQQGFGITAFLEKVLDDEPGLVAIPFVEPLSLDIRLAWRKDGYLSVANSAFRDFILEERTVNSY